MRVLAAGLVIAALVAAAPGCGGGQPAGSIKVAMNEYKFNPNHLDVKAGKVVFYLVNAGNLSHDMVIVGAGDKRLGKSDLVQAGNAATFTVADLAPGTYKFYCDVTGHRELGMEGTIQVT